MLHDTVTISSRGKLYKDRSLRKALQRLVRFAQQLEQNDKKSPDIIVDGLHNENAQQDHIVLKGQSQ